MMAWEAGCRLANLEFIQFHPTGLVYNDENGSSNFLISGSGARRKVGYRVAQSATSAWRQTMIHVKSWHHVTSWPEPLPTRLLINGVGYVHLDISHKPADFIKQHFQIFMLTV